MAGEPIGTGVDAGQLQLDATGMAGHTLVHELLGLCPVVGP